jgi:midasin
VANNMSVHLVHCLMVVRRMIGRSLNELGFLQRSIFVLESSMIENHRQSAYQYKSFQEALSTCLMATESSDKYLALLLESQQECIPLSKIADLQSLLRTNHSNIDHWSKMLSHERAKSIEILDGEFFVTRSMKIMLDDCQKSCASICRNIIGYCSDSIPGILDLKTSFENLLLSCEGDTVGPIMRGIPLSDAVMIQHGQNLLDSCLIWAQQMSMDTKEDASIVHLISNVVHLLALPSVKELNQKLKNAFDCLYRSDKEFLDFKLLLVNLIPLIRAIQQQVENFILHLLSMHRALSKLSLISISIFCSLVEHGFCIADDGNEETQDVDQTKDGTGLGDGDTKGAKDISNQLEDEDQLLGADFQEQRNEKGNDEGSNDQDQHEKDQGVEMEDDFEGAMEDASPEESQHTEEEEEGENQQLDQQLGDADNANEVDQRVWDGEEEEEKPVDDENKDKQTQNKNEKEYAQGNEDDGQMNEEENRDSAGQDSKEDLPKDTEGASDEKEDEEEGSDYNENVNTGFLEQEMPEDQLELPEDMNLDQEDDVDMDSFNDKNGNDDDGENISEDNEKDQPSMEDMSEEMEGPDDSQDGIGDLDDKTTVEGENADKPNEFTDNDGIDSHDDIGAQDSGGASDEKDEHNAVHGGPHDNEQGQDEETGDIGDGNATSKHGDVPLDKTGEGEKQENGSLETNPFRSVNAAAERWERKNAIDLVDFEADNTDIAEKGEKEITDQEYRFVNDAEMMDGMEANVMADATNEQAQQGVNHDIPEEQTREDPVKDLQQEEMMLKDSEDQKQAQNKVMQEKDVAPAEGKEEPRGEDLPDTRDLMAETGGFQLGEVKQQAKEEIICSGDLDDEKKRLREELEERIKLMSKEPIDGNYEQDFDLDYGRKVWSNCEALTSQLSGELAEQLRLILEPTTASKLGGEYRSGKRINMKRVIGYIASHFRKDKIWMRRTQPDKRQYQVILAIDDSRSMAENSCGGFALESLALICNAMSRIDIGDFGIIRFGGSIGADLLHQPGQPFSSTSDGAKIMSKMKFDADNTINDRPMVDVLTSMDAILEEQDHKVANTSSVLQQLVIILADGRFHEKESLKKAVMNATSRSGVMYAFIVLDSSSNSILDMQSVSFGEDGKPVFSKYIDSFPFPLYIVLQDIQELPRALSDLLRQWIEYSANS